MNLLLLYVYCVQLNVSDLSNVLIFFPDFLYTHGSAYSLYYSALQRSGGFPEKFVKCTSHRAVTEPRMFIFLRKSIKGGEGRIFFFVFCMFFWEGFSECMGEMNKCLGMKVLKRMKKLSNKFPIF